MKLSALLLLSTFTGSNAFYQSHDIITHDDGSVHLFEKTQHRRLATKNLKANSDTAANTKFTVHGSEYITGQLHVDGDLTVGGFEFESSADIFGDKALNSLAGSGLSVSSGQLQNSVYEITHPDLLIDGTTGIIMVVSVGGKTVEANVPSNAVFTDTQIADTNTQLNDNQVNSALTGTGVGVALGSITHPDLTIDGTTGIITVDTVNGKTVEANVPSNAVFTDTVLTAAADSGITISGAGAISARMDTGAIKDALDALEAADTTTAVQKEYRLERMVLLLCNTLGLKFEHLVRAVDGVTFDPYERFSAIQVNDDDLYSTASNSNFVVVTDVSTALCSTYSGYASACADGYSNRHALAMCVSGTCAPVDFTASGLCCVPT